jgi:hypothetical protein
MDTHHRVLNIRSFALFAFALAFSACSFFGGAPITISAWSPSVEIPALAGLEVWVEFSAPVDRVKAEQAFSLTENGGSMDGVFAWNGNRMAFTPHPAVSRGNEYEISVDGSVEDPAGVSLDKEFHFRFTTKAERTRPSIVSAAPLEDSTLDDRYAPVVLSFSEPVDKGSYYSSFLISPSVNGVYAWNPQGTQCSFTPIEPYAWGTEYRVTVETGLKDLNGNRLVEEFHLNFSIGTDRTAPAMASVRNVVGSVPGAVTAVPDDPDDAVFTVNADWECPWGFEITLTEPVPRLGVENYFRFEPAWSFRIDSTAASSASFILVPQERLAYDTVYTLMVRDGLADMQGNTMAQDAVYRFHTNGAGSTPPVVERIRFRANPLDAVAEYDEYFPADIYSVLVLDPDEGFIINPAIPTRSYFDVYIRTAEGAGIDLMDLLSCFSISATNACASLSIPAVQTSGFDDPQPDPPAAGSVVARIIVDVSNRSPSGVVTMMLSAVFEDSAGNPIAGAWQFPLLK